MEIRIYNNHGFYSSIMNMVICLEIDISVKMKDEKMLTAIDHKQNRTQTKDWLNEMQY